MKSDSQIQKDVMNQLDFDPAIQSQKIGVSVEGGVVTLSGTVPSYAEKYLAEKRAFAVSGVNSVVENITVEIPGHHKRSDLDIAKAISETFEWHIRIPASVTASVEEGIVTLQGAVDWKYQKDAANDAAKHVKGVKGIINLISLRLKATPYDVKEMIEKALVRSAQDDARHISVQVVDDRAVLTGKVHSRAELEDAKWAAWAAPGIIKVESNLEVV